MSTPPRRTKIREPLPAAGDVRLSTLCEVLCSAHLSSLVVSPIPDRGGVMLVAPPGALKTTALRVLDRGYTSALAYSNLNTRTLMKLRQELVSGATRSIIFPDLQSVYAGDPRTADRLEQSIMQLVGEGSIGASWEDSRHRRFESRCTVFGAMTNDFFEFQAERWERNGFLRRFVWFFYTLKNPNLLTDALVQWEKVRINGMTTIPQQPVGDLKDETTADERREMIALLKHQPGPKEIRLVLLSRTLTALRWHYRRIGDPRDPMETMREFARGLSDRAVNLIA